MSTGPSRKDLAWLHGEIKTPPFSRDARVEAGVFLRLLQQGESLAIPHSRPMTSIGPRCHELRIRDEDRNWRVVCRIDTDVVVIAEVFAKTTQQTPKSVIDKCRRRLSRYDEASRVARQERSKQSGPKERGNP